MGKFKTKQESFWFGKFGNEYIARNAEIQLVKKNVNLFSKIFKKKRNIRSVIEFGANIGLNLLALGKIIPKAKISAIEINKEAVRELEKIKGISVYQGSILDFKPDYQSDLVLIKTVLIHINPKVLDKVYEILYESAGKYICIAEYYNPTPVAINYRGHANRLFKRDFAGEMLEKYKDLKLIDYGFYYHRDKDYDDDLNWFLLKKC